LVHQHDHRLGKADREGRGKYTDRAFAEELARLARSDAEDQRKQDAEDDIDRADLREGPPQSDTAVSLDNDHAEKGEQTEYTADIHFFQAVRMVFFPQVHVFIA